MSDAEQPGHLGAQFSDFSFRAHSGTFGTSVVAYHNSEFGEDPVGSLSISPHNKRELQNHNEEQEFTNKHGLGSPITEVDRADVIIEKQLPGQMRWSRGAFARSEPAHVSWLGMDTRRGSKATMAKVLSRMMSLGVAHHGSMPRADAILSREGAAMSRGMARKYGMKAHPANPNMTGRFSYDDDDGMYSEGAAEAGERARTDASVLSSRNTPYTAEEADAVHQRVDEAYHVNKRRPDEETEPEAFAAWQEKRNRRPVRGQMRLPGI